MSVITTTRHPEAGAPGAESRPSVPMGRRVRAVVKRVDPITVLKFSVLFYLSMFVVVLVAGTLLWLGASSAGAIHNVEKFIKGLFALDSFHFRGLSILEGAALGGAVMVVLGSGLNVLMAVLYNLISDVVGGVEVQLLEEEPRRRSVV